MSEKLKVAVIYYSATGTNYQLAKWAKESAEAEDAEVRLVKAPELAPEAAIASNPAWEAHVKATQDVSEANSEDIEWADALIFSVPTRFGNMASQMKQFLDIQGGIWGSGKTVNKFVTAMSSAGKAHGVQEANILSLYKSMYYCRVIVVTTGYTEHSVFLAGGNPYGTSVTVEEDCQMLEQVES